MVIPLYISEVSQPEIRGALVVLQQRELTTLLLIPGYHTNNATQSLSPLVFSFHTGLITEPITSVEQDAHLTYHIPVVLWPLHHSTHTPTSVQVDATDNPTLHGEFLSHSRLFQR